MNPPDRPDSLSIIVFSGDFERVHYALVLAAGAAALGTPVTLFFTMGATRALVSADPDGAPGWRALPAGSDATGAEVDAGFAARGVATFEELLSACVEMEVRFLVCEMGLRALDIDRAILRDDVRIAEGGVATFLNGASRTGAMLFV